MEVHEAAPESLQEVERHAKNIVRDTTHFMAKSIVEITVEYYDTYSSGKP